MQIFLQKSFLNLCLCGYTETKNHPTGDGPGVGRIIENPNGKILDDEDTSICRLSFYNISKAKNVPNPNTYSC
jgi:hypothetical protein